MDLQLSSDQLALVSALQAILVDHGEIPVAERDGHFRFDGPLQDLLAEHGFLDAASAMGELESALVVFECAKIASVVDALGRGFVAPLVTDAVAWSGPVALAGLGSLGKAIRNLPIAAHLLIEDGNDVLLAEIDQSEVVPVESILAYPYGRLANDRALGSARRIAGAGPLMRRAWRTGLAAEIAGASRGAIDFTLDYVRNRKVFGRAVGSFQSVQHRLVMRHGHALAGYYLAMRAAWSGHEADAANAACHAQSGIGELLFDLHQFNGGMGMTNEHLLHFWLYRIRALQSDLGGPSAAALDIARLRWGREPASQAQAAVTELVSQ